VTFARVLAPAKVTPWLAVLGPRADGFHEVDLGLLALDLSDVVEARLTHDDTVHLELRGPAVTEDVPADEHNLVWRAAQAVRRLGEEYDHRGVALRLEKYVPSRAGLGGGSSDAAAACLATALVLGFEPHQWADELQAILTELGSDCPFFLAAAQTGYARGTGRGEQLEVLPAVPDSWHVVVVTPAVELSTRAVYARVAVGEPDPRRRVCSVDFSGTGDEVRAALYNDLEAPALAMAPELVEWRELLDAAAPGARMSGSGSSFFALFRDRAHAEARLAEILAAAKRRRLAVRGAWVTRPAHHGVRRIP